MFESGGGHRWTGTLHSTDLECAEIFTTLRAVVDGVSVKAQRTHKKREIEL
jgi:hypothetical protein